MSPEQHKQGRRHLRRSDPVMRDLIDAVGPQTLKLRPQRFQMLVRSILAQQISTLAARSIRRRFDRLVTPGAPTAAKVAKLSIEEMQSAGLSQQKAKYLHDLSAKVLDGTVKLRTIHRRSDDEVIAELSQVKGIGVWTAQMFLMFCLGRPDVFPHGDLGIRNALRNLYALDELPDQTTSEELCAVWRPHATLASLYLWRSHDLKTGAAAGPEIFPC